MKYFSQLSRNLDSYLNALRSLLGQNESQIETKFEKKNQLRGIFFWENQHLIINTFSIYQTVNNINQIELKLRFSDYTISELIIQSANCCQGAEFPSQANYPQLGANFFPLTVSLAQSCNSEELSLHLTGSLRESVVTSGDGSYTVSD